MKKLFKAAIIGIPIVLAILVVGYIIAPIEVVAFEHGINFWLSIGVWQSSSSSGDLGDFALNNDPLIRSLQGLLLYPISYLFFVVLGSIASVIIWPFMFHIVPTLIIVAGLLIGFPLLKRLPVVEIRLHAPGTDKSAKKYLHK